MSNGLCHHEMLCSIGIQSRNCRMPGTAESTELWRLQMFFTFLKKRGYPQPLFTLFSIFWTIETIFRQIKMWTMNNLISDAGIWTHDLSKMSLLPQPLDKGSRQVGITFLILSVSVSYLEISKTKMPRKKSFETDIKRITKSLIELTSAPATTTALSRQRIKYPCAVAVVVAVVVVVK